MGGASFLAPPITGCVRPSSRATLALSVSGHVRIGQGREAEILDYGDGRVLRLLWNTDRELWLDREEAALRAASAAGAPVPSVYERTRVDGRPGLVMERLDGSDLLTRLGRRPWTVLSAGRLLGRIHSRLHAVPAPTTLPPLKGQLLELLERQAERVPADLATEAHERLAELPDGDRLCHGDYHPANVLLAPGGPRVIDWAGASRGDPIADVCRTRLLIELGEVPAHAPVLVRRLDRAGRSLLLRSYLRSYGRPDRGLLDDWQRVIAITRLAEGIDAERGALMRLLEAGPGFGTSLSGR
jgi:aminoglycoside phosphotransferase (APT) family kinase protein